MKKILIILLPLVISCGENSSEPHNNIPKEVLDIEGEWQFEAYSSFMENRLDISDGLLTIDKTMSEGWPYILNGTLSNTSLKCIKDINVVLWEEPLEGVSVQLGRGILAMGIEFDIPSSIGVISFDCSAGLFPEDIIKFDYISGEVRIDVSSTNVAIDGYGRFTATKIQ